MGYFKTKMYVERDGVTTEKMEYHWFTIYVIVSPCVGWAGLLIGEIFGWW